MELYILGVKQSDGLGQWVRLPVAESELPAGSLTVCLLDDNGSYFEGIAEAADRSQLPSLNRLALLLQSLSEAEEAKLNALLECESSTSICVVKRLVAQLPQTALFVGVTDDEALGRYHMEHNLHIVLPRQIAVHFDYRGYGAAVRERNLGIFTSAGFLMYNF